MTVTAQLHRLEQLDSELERCRLELIENQSRQRRNPDLERAEATRDAVVARERATTAEQRSLESDLASLDGRIKRDNTRMYAGEIVDSRELSSLERELEHLRAQKDAVEEHLLQVMELAEGLQREATTARENVDRLRQEWEQEVPVLGHRAGNIKESLVSLQRERDSLAESLEPRTLSQYQRLRDHLGHAVVSAAGGVCQACRVGIPPKDIQHVRAGALVACSNCGRILFGT